MQRSRARPITTPGTSKSGSDCKPFMTRRLRLRSAVLGIALSYSQVVILPVFLWSNRSPSWLRVVALFPWIGMALPFIFPVIAVALLVGWLIRPGQDPGVTWNDIGFTGDFSMFVLLGITMILFLVPYIGVLISLYRHDGTVRRWLVAILVMWSLFGGLVGAMFQPRQWEQLGRQTVQH